MPGSDPGMNATFDLVSVNETAASKSQQQSPPSAARSSSSPAIPGISAGVGGVGGQHYVAQLALESVRRSQGGNYSCSPSNASPVSVRLHLIDGNKYLLMTSILSWVYYSPTKDPAVRHIRLHWCSIF